MGAAEHKACVGKGHTFLWLSPQALDLSDKGPTLALAGVSLPPGEDELGCIHTEETVTAVSPDLRELTAPGLEAATSKGAAGRHGRAWLITADEGVFNVHVAQIRDGIAVLAHALPQSFEGEARLQWATWYLALPTVATAARRRGVRYDVGFTRLAGDIFESPDGLEVGLFHVVDVPFTTGLSSEDVLEVFPDLRREVERGRQDLGGRIRFAERLLISRVRRYLQGRTSPDGVALTEDDMKTPQALREAHAFLTASLVVEADLERTRRLEARGYELADEALRAVWLDEDQDGNADEAPAAVSGPALPVPVGSTATQPTAPRFTRDRLH